MNIEIAEEFLDHMTTQDLGHFTVTRVNTVNVANDTPVKDAYMFATSFGNLVFMARDGRYENASFTGLDSHKLAVCRAFCDVCESFANFNDSYTVVGGE